MAIDHHHFTSQTSDKGHDATRRLHAILGNYKDSLLKEKETNMKLRHEIDMLCAHGIKPLNDRINRLTIELHIAYKAIVVLIFAVVVLLFV